MAAEKQRAGGYVMQHRLVTATMAIALSLSVTTHLQAAAFGAFRHGSTEKAASAKTISFNVRNDSKETLVLKSGDQQYTIDPGKIAAFKLAEGAEIVNVTGNSHQAPGTVLTKVSKMLQGNTLAVS